MYHIGQQWERKSIYFPSYGFGMRGREKKNLRWKKCRIEDVRFVPILPCWTLRPLGRYLMMGSIYRVYICIGKRNEKGSRETKDCERWKVNYRPALVKINSTSFQQRQGPSFFPRYPVYVFIHKYIYIFFPIFYYCLSTSSFFTRYVDLYPFFSVFSLLFCPCRCVDRSVQERLVGYVERGLQYLNFSRALSCAPCCWAANDLAPITIYLEDRT